MLDLWIVKYYIGYRFNLNFIGFNLLNLGQLLVVEQSRLKETQTLAQSRTDPWSLGISRNARVICCTASKGPGIRFGRDIQ